MTATLFNTEQTIQNPILDQVTAATNKGLNLVLASVNSELTAPLRLTRHSSNVREIVVGSNVIVNPETGKNRSALPVKSLIPSFSSGSITFPSTDSGTITISPGTNVTMPTIGNNYYLKVGIGVNELGNITLSFGAPGASVSAATTPKLQSPKANDCGYVVVGVDGSGNVNTINTTDIYQYSGGGAGGGGLLPTYIGGSTTLSATLEAGKLYIVDMVNATADFNLTLPTMNDDDQLTCVIVNNADKTYRSILVGGSQTIRYNNMSGNDLKVVDSETWISVAKANGSSIIYTYDAKVPLNGTLSGNLDVTGALSFPVTSLSNAQATSMGLKQYAHGTTYNGGNAPTVTSAATSPTITSSSFIPYQMQDGSWRMKFNLLINASSSGAYHFSIAGITIPRTQSYVARTGNGILPDFAANDFCYSNGTFYCAFASGVTDMAAFGDIALSAKPTWAY